MLVEILTVLDDTPETENKNKVNETAEEKIKDEPLPVRVRICQRHRQHLQVFISNDAQRSCDLRNVVTHVTS